MGWWTDIWLKRAETWTHGPLSSSQVPDGLQHTGISADSSYISVFLRSIRVVNVRKGLNKFYGTAHSYISLSHVSGEKAKFNVITTPTHLIDIDAAHIDRVISINKRLLGPIPYRGGDMEMEIGLLSIKSTELAGPYLAILEKMSTVAGVSYVNMALPFAGPLMEGINLLAGAQQDNILEVGFSRTFEVPETGYFVVIGAPKGTIELTSLKLGEDFQLQDVSGKAFVDYPYMVFCIAASTERDDFHQIPELSVAYKELKSAVRTGRLDLVNDAMGIFKRVTLMSPDLLFEDGKRIVQKVDEQLRSVLTATRTSATPGSEIPDLDQINIY